MNLPGRIIRRVAFGRVGIHRTGQALGQLIGPRIVGIDNSVPAQRKKAFFGGQVIFHGLVVVEMILGQVGKNRRVEGTALHPILIQRVGGYLHDAVGAALRRHEREHALQVIRIRGGVSRRQHPGADHILDGTDKPDLVAAGLQHRLEHAGGGGFPVGAGDPHHMQLFRRPAEPVGAHKRPGPAGRGSQKLAGKPHVPLRDNDRRPGLRGLFSVGVAVLRGPLDAHEGPARLHPAGIAGDARDLPVQFRRAGNAGAVQQL